MPRRDDIHSILVIGSGPIVIGQGAEFDYSGTQACKVLKQEGYRVILVNSNPATIMTDPHLADRTYIEPLTAGFVERIIQAEHPDALLPTLGGQTALNIAMELHRSGVLEREGVEMIGCKAQAIERGEDRQLFQQCMAGIGLEMARGDYAHSLDDARRISGELGFPLVLRPSFTLGGAGGGIAHDLPELERIAAQGLALSPIDEVLLEQSVEGWKEYEMEVMRDCRGNAIVICSIENLDPMGVHTGDSITVAPALTLSDPEYQRMRRASLNILEAIGVETGGSNVQFAVNPHDGRMLVIEMNPRVSRSSALASKATGFPIAKAAAKLAVGYCLDEIENDVTGQTLACFEPTLDYCVVKVPRFDFEKFHGSDDLLSTRMRAVGEVMAIGRTFEEALGKALRSLEDGSLGLGPQGHEALRALGDEPLAMHLSLPRPDRIFAVAEALARGWDVPRLHGLTGIDPWFLHRMADIVALTQALGDGGLSLDELDAPAFRLLKGYGVGDAQMACRLGVSELDVRARRLALGVRPAFKTVDTCAAEFASVTSYHYKTYDAYESEVCPVPGRRGGGSSDILASGPHPERPGMEETARSRVMILGAGPNRIGQGIEFDYCCVQASFALHEAGFETIMVNCNPETVSTDYDSSDMLFFEPLTFEDVMDIVEATQPVGVIVGLGGQTPLKLSAALQAAGVPILGTSPASIALAENRDEFAALLDRLGIAYPPARMASSYQEACAAAETLGFPLLLRPSFVLGGRGMAIVSRPEQLREFMDEAIRVTPEHPVYLDRFLEDAVELDLDCLCDGHEVYIGGILEHIEMAGIHSGDSACCIPPFTLSLRLQRRLRDIATQLALQLQVRGLLNVQFAVKGQQVYVLEANPRASRTVPFISKATGVALARIAALLMCGQHLCDLQLPPDDREPRHFCVKEAVLPFGRFPGASAVLGPEMKSTGEVMGIARSFPQAYIKTQIAVGYELAHDGTVLIAVRDEDKRSIGQIACALADLGFKLAATPGTARTLRALGLEVAQVAPLGSGAGSEPGIEALIDSGELKLIVNTPSGENGHDHGFLLRTAAVQHGITYITTMAAAQAFTVGLESSRASIGLPVIALQDL